MDSKRISKLLTLDDLCDYYANHKNSVTYSAEKNNNCPVVVQVEASLTFSEDDYDPELSLLKAHLQSCHIGSNRNRSRIEREVMDEALTSIYNRPILGFIHKLPDGTYDFAGHEMFVNDDGELEYEEIPVGCIPESGDAKLVYDTEKEKTYLEVDGIIYEEYTKAADILKEKKECKVSVELALLDYSYNPKEKEMIIDRFYFTGVTILGKDRHTLEPIGEGMLGSNIKLKDFKSNNSMFNNNDVVFNQKLIDALDKLNNVLSNFNIKESKEGGIAEMTKFEELLEKYNKTENDIEFEVEGLSDEELESKFEEVFGVKNTEEEPTAEPASVEIEEPETIDEVVVETDENVVDTLEDTEDTEEPTDDVAETHSLVERTMEINGKKFTVCFELSHDDIRSALYNLIVQYDEMDNDWYCIREVFDDRFIFSGLFTGKIFGQNYSKDDNTVSLDGERWELFEELLTASEKAELESMRANYSSIQTELNTYKAAEAYADKMTVFDDESYAQFLETPEFKELMKKENVDKYSKEELEDKANITFSKLVKKNKTFSLVADETHVEKPKHTTMFTFGRIEQKTSFLDQVLNKEK